MKKLLAAAIAAAIVSPVVAAADSNNVTVYGQVKLALTNFDRNGNGDDDWAVTEQSGASLLGFKGTEDLGNGLKAIWKMEFDVPVGRGSSPISGGSPVSSTRNAYIGLAGDFGTFLVGRHDSPYKVAFGKFDLFPDTVADFNDASTGFNSLFDDKRVQDTLVYISPSFSGLTVAGAIVTGSGSENTVLASDDDEALAQHYSFGAMYDNNGIMASLGYEFLDGSTFNRPMSDPAFDDDEKWSMALGYKGNNFYVGGRYEDRSARGGFSNNDTESWQVAASYTMGNTVFKGAYGEIDYDALGTSPESWVIGMDHNLSKRTQVFALYIDADGTPTSGSTDDISAFSVGMSHKF